MPSSVTHLVLADDGQTLFGADAQGTIRRLDWPSGKVTATWQQHRAQVTRLALSQNGRMLASGDSQGQVTLWHLPTAEPVRTLSRQPGAVTAIAWLAQDQAVVVAGWDVCVRWRSPHTSGILQTVKAQGFFLPVRSLLPHPTKLIVVAGSQDGQLQAWPLASEHSRFLTKQQLIAADSDSAPIIDLCLQPTGAANGAVLVSLTETGRLTTRSHPF
jgi:WD40 repeat protein